MRRQNPLDPENLRRAQQAMEALASAGYLDDASAEEGVIDLLSDLRHYAGWKGIDFDRADRIAEKHWMGEVDRDDIERTAREGGGFMLTDDEDDAADDE